MRLARIGVWQVLDHILSSLLVPFLRDDDVSFPVVLSGSGIDPSDLLDKERLRWCFFGTSPTPRPLERFRREDADNAVKVERGRTHPGKVVSTSFGASSRISRCLASWKSCVRINGYDAPI